MPLLFRRWGRLAALAARVAARKCAQLLRRPFVSRDRREALAAAAQLHSAEDVAATLGNMKGALMKVGQLLSFVDEGLPEPVRAALAQLQDSAPPMAPGLARSVVREELGEEPDRVFRKWDPNPMAAASIGQVHRATLHDGTDVVVKVQYPGVADAMEADLAQLDLARFIMPAMWPNLDAAAVTAELRDRLREELDYTLEARNQADFVRWYDGHPFIRIPAVVRELSTRRVLTTVYDPGLRFADLERRPQSERDFAGEAIFRFVYRSLHDHLAFNGDPHPGNYLFMGTDHVTFLDFGLVKRVTPAARDHQRSIALAAALDPDLAGLRRAVENAGFFPEDAPLTDQEVYDFSSMFWEHLRDDRPTTITPEFASATVRRYLFKGPEFAKVDRWGALPPDHVVLQRLTVGLLAVLGSLHATANWHRIVEELWFAGPPATPMGAQEAAWRAGRHGDPRVMAP